MVIIDELAYIDKGLWDETIRALLNMKNAGLIGITTPRGPDNFVSLLVNMTNDDGTPFFNVLQMTTICDVCAQLPTVGERLACNHAWIPTYKSREKQSRNARIAAATDSLAMTMQEDAGVSESGMDGKMFDPAKLRLVFNRGANKRHELIFDDPTYIPHRIYVMSDPNADPRSPISSNSTALSCFWAPPAEKGGYNRCVILGIDAEKYGSSASKDKLILRHIKRIRSIPAYSQVPIIYVPENNTGSYATQGERITERLQSVVVLWEKGHGIGKPGIRKGVETAAVYCQNAEMLMDNGQLVWSSDLFTLSENFVKHLKTIDASTQKTSIEWMMNELFIGMCRIQRDKTGKITGKVGPFQDDLPITLMMAMYWSRCVENTQSQTFEYYRKLEFVSSPVQTSLQTADEDATNQWLSSSKKDGRGGYNWYSPVIVNTEHKKAQQRQMQQRYQNDEEEEDDEEVDVTPQTVFNTTRSRKRPANNDNYDDDDDIGPPATKISKTLRAHHLRQFTNGPFNQRNF